MLRKFLIFLSFVSTLCIYASPKLVYVLSIGKEIDALTWRYTSQALNKADELRADLFVVNLNTYGGSLQEADSIRTALMRCRIPTIALVDHNAASAGALIALACDSVFMTEGSSMGAATVVNQTGEALPDKYQSYMRSIMRSTAEAHGKRMSGSDSTQQWLRDPLIAEAMVDHRIAVEGLIDSTKVLTFTPSEAVKWGYAQGMTSSLSDMLAQLGYKEGEYVTDYFTPTLTDEILGFLSNNAVRALLIAVITAGLFFELKTPGIGFAGGAAVVAAVLYFLPMCITGTVAGWVLILFMAGLVALALEIFVIPGFGVAGIAGTLAIITSVIAGLIQEESLMGISKSDIANACVVFFSGVIVAAVLIWFLTSRFAPKFMHRTVALDHSQKIEDGYIGVDMHPITAIGKTGSALTDLRPSGKVSVDGEVFDAVSESGFIESGSQVKVLRHGTSQIYVIKDN